MIIPMILGTKQRTSDKWVAIKENNPLRQLSRSWNQQRTRRSLVQLILFSVNNEDSCCFDGDCSCCTSELCPQWVIIISFLVAALCTQVWTLRMNYVSLSCLYKANSGGNEALLKQLLERISAQERENKLIALSQGLVYSYCI